MGGVVTEESTRRAALVSADVSERRPHVTPPPRTRQAHAQAPHMHTTKNQSMSRNKITMVHGTRAAAS